MIYKTTDVRHPALGHAHEGAHSAHPPHAHDASMPPCKSHELHLKRKEEQMLFSPDQWKDIQAIVKQQEAMLAADERARANESAGARRPAQPSSFKSPAPATVDADNGAEKEAVISRAKRGDAAEPVIENLPESPSIHDGMPVMAYPPPGSRIRAAKQVTTYEVVDWADVPASVRDHFRKKAARAAANKKIDKRKTTCMLYLQADHLFYEKMGSEEATIDVMTRHVQRVNSIYKEIGELKFCLPYVRSAFSLRFQSRGSLGKFSIELVLGIGRRRGGERLIHVIFALK